MMKKRLILVEGCDCTGKSTLVNYLSRRLENWQLHHQGPYLSDDIVSETLETLHHVTTDTILCDRLHLGERVYGPVFRGVDKLGQVGQAVLDDLLVAQYDPRVVICCPPFDTVARFWVNRRDIEMLDNLDQLLEVYQGFANITTKLPLMFWDWTTQSFEEVETFCIT